MFYRGKLHISQALSTGLLRKVQCGHVQGWPFDDEKLSYDSRPGVLDVDILVSLLALEGRLFKELYDANMSCSNVAHCSDFFQSRIASVLPVRIASSNGSIWSYIWKPNTLNIFITLYFTPIYKRIHTFIGTIVLVAMYSSKWKSDIASGNESLENCIK